MTYTSYVLLIPAAYRDQINELADTAGYGPSNLSVLLEKADTAQWYGCHFWAKPESLEFFDNAGPEYQQAVSSMVKSSMQTNDALVHWRQALTDNGLTEVGGDDADFNP